MFKGLRVEPYGGDDLRAVSWLEPTTPQRNQSGHSRSARWTGSVVDAGPLEFTFRAGGNRNLRQRQVGQGIQALLLVLVAERIEQDAETFGLLPEVVEGGHQLTMSATRQIL